MHKNVDANNSVHYTVYLELGIVDNSLDTSSSLHYSFISFIVVLTIKH